MSEQKLILCAILLALTLASFAPIIPRYNLVISRDEFGGWSVRVEKARQP